MRLYVGNLSFNTSDKEVFTHFQSNGFKPTQVKIVTDRETGKSRGFCFVDLASANEAQQAIQTLNGSELSGRKLRINLAEDKRQNNQNQGPSVDSRYAQTQNPSQDSRYSRPQTPPFKEPVSTQPSVEVKVQPLEYPSTRNNQPKFTDPPKKKFSNADYQTRSDYSDGVEKERSRRKNPKRRKHDRREDYDMDDWD